MAATVVINRHTGTATGSPANGTTLTDISGGTRLSYSDSPSPGTSNPIPIPAAGTNRSWWASTRLSATTTPTTAIQNIKWFSDGTSFGTGLVCMGQTAAAATGYTQATGSGGAGTSGTILNTTNYTALSAATVDVTTLTSGSPKSVTGSISNPSTGNFGDFFVFQLEVGTTASVGLTTARTFTWQYDET